MTCPQEKSKSLAESIILRDDNTHWSPLSTPGMLVTTDTEKAEVLNSFFASVSTGNLSSHTSQVDEL